MYLCLNIALCTLTALAGGAWADEHPESDFVPLFNGEDLTGWLGDTEGYQAEEGLLVCKPGGNLYTEAEYSDFVLRFEFKLTPGANNGIGLRVEPGAKASIEAMEIQILDDTAEKFREIHDYQHHGSVYGVVPAIQGHLRPVGEWNEQEILLEGSHIKVTLNGAIIVDADLEEAAKNGTIDGKAHPGLKRTSGHLGLLGHGSVLYFRNLRVKALSR